MYQFSPLSNWLRGNEILPHCIDKKNITPDFEFGGFLSLDYCIPMYEIIDLPAQSLNASWEKSNEYFKKALKLIDCDCGIQLDKEEAQIIRNELGEPPPHCYPIYIITISSNENEKIMYIGKTSSKYSRFSRGHVAACKLLHPKYNNFSKNLYLCCVMLLNNQNYLPLEWVHPKEFALDILDYVESKLIYFFRPEFNIMKKNCFNDKYRMSIQIQNFVENSLFLNDKMVY
jgi:hypothetical protein